MGTGTDQNTAPLSAQELPKKFLFETLILATMLGEVCQAVGVLHSVRESRVHGKTCDLRTAAAYPVRALLMSELEQLPHSNAEATDGTVNSTKVLQEQHTCEL